MTRAKIRTLLVEFFYRVPVTQQKFSEVAGISNNLLTYIMRGHEPDKPVSRIVEVKIRQTIEQWKNEGI